MQENRADLIDDWVVELLAPIVVDVVPDAMVELIDLIQLLQLK